MTPPHAMQWDLRKCRKDKVDHEFTKTAPNGVGRYYGDKNMNDNWYNCENWYEPQHETAAVQPEKKQGKHRIFNIVIVLLLLCSFALSLVAISSGRSASNSGGGYTLPDSNSAYDFNSGNMPEDWHDFLDYLYGGTTEDADYPMERVDERGELSLVKASGGDTLGYGEIFEKCSPSVVYVKGGFDDKSGYNWGTGIIASSDGYILTNAHVIEGCNYVEVGISGGKSYEAKLVGVDEDSDIAILKIKAKNLTPASFAAADSVSVGDTAIAIGNPLGEEYSLTMTDGIISALDRSVSYEGKTMHLLQTSTAINEGNSGGPLINDKGQVIGITNMKIISSASGVEGIGFAIPTDTIFDVVSSIMADGAVYGRATIGITIGVITEDVAEYYDIPNGLYLAVVNEKSDAYEQGMRKGDIITEVNGKTCDSTSVIAEEKAALDIGDTLKFTVWRDGKTLSFTVKIMDAQDLK